MQSGQSSTSSAQGLSPEPASVPPRTPGHARTIGLLGAGAMGLAWALTTTAAYLPPLLERFTSSTTVIAVITAGAEGVIALTLPLVIGPWSDTFHTPLGRRRPFMLAAVGPLGFCLALLAFMPNLWTTTLVILAFFFAYYVYEPPYRGLYPDVLPGSLYGRAQGVQHLFRGVALGGALVGGGAIFNVWQPGAFLLAAAVVTAACLVPVVFIVEDGGHGPVFEGVGTYLRQSWRVLRSNREVALFLAANSALEGTFAGARTFVVLYITIGLHESSWTSTKVLAAVAGGYILAALVSGPLGDRYGLARVMVVGCAIYGAALVLGGAAQRWHEWYLGIIFVVAIAAGAVMTLAWGLLFKLMPPSDRGAISGLATTSKGFGLIVGPIFAGIVIDLLRPYLEATEGYQATWPVLGVPILLSIPLMVKLISAERRADGKP